MPGTWHNEIIYSAKTNFIFNKKFFLWEQIKNELKGKQPQLNLDDPKLENCDEKATKEIFDLIKT